MRAAVFRSCWAVFWRQVVRDVFGHKLLLVLNVASVGLGIAVYLAIHVAMHSANRSFSAGMDLVAGKSTLEVRGAMPDLWLQQAWAHPAVEAVTPLVEGYLTLPDFPGEYLHLLGIDLFTNEPFRTFELGGQFAAESWLGESDAIALTAEFARKHGLKVGDKLRVVANARSKEMTVRFLTAPDESTAGANNRFAAMDIGWAQELLEMRGRVSSLQLLLKDPSRLEEVAQELRPLFPGTQVQAPGRRSFQIQKMLSAFELNLRALSMVSLLVGMFLIYNTISASVARRRADIGILRALGASANHVRWMFLGEALLFAGLGVVLGVIGGVGLGQGLLGSVASTISSLYIVTSIDRLFVHPLHLAGAVFFGGAAALVGGWLPADQAARLDPMAAITLNSRADNGHAHAGKWLVLGILSFFLAGLCSWLALVTTQAWLSFGAAFFVLVGLALMAPAATWAAGKGIARLLKAKLLWRLAGENLWRALGRNSMTVAALSTAIAMMSAVAIMIFSFRTSVEGWVEQAMLADIYIAPAANEVIGMRSFMPEEARKFALPEIEALETHREADVELSLNNGAEFQESTLVAVGGGGRGNLRFEGGAGARKMQELFSGAPVVAVSESFSRKFRVGEGQSLLFKTPRGMFPVRVIGVYSDYSRDRGVVMMDARLFEKQWSDARFHSMALYLRGGSSPERVAALFRERLGGEFAVYFNWELRQRVLHIFDQTFAVTHVLRVIAVLVAVAGLFLSMTTLVVERRRETGLLRAVGAARGQVQKLFMSEALLAGVLASLLGLVGGVLLAMVLTWVVNRAFFGWTIALGFPLVSLIATPVWMGAVALLAAWMPAAKAGRTQIAEALHNE